MVKKTPPERKPNTLDAISGTDAIEVLRVLANRDKALSKEIDVIARIFWPTFRWTKWQNLFRQN